MSDNKVKLLIVEDDKEIRELLGAFLTDNGYEISYAANGIEATNKFTPEYDLVLLDIPLFSECQFLSANHQLSLQHQQ